MQLIETENVGDLLGLLEILEDVGKSVDIATLDDSLDEERTTLLNLLEDGKSLGFINVEKGDVTLTPLGKEFEKSDVNMKKEILKRQLTKVEPFVSLIALLRNKENMEINKEDLYDFINENFPSDNNESTFRMITNWGRYSRLIDYDVDRDQLFLRE
ncbi:AAA-associated domain-containing protein [Oxyplasma meridianum]|uniref:AAA-associated domain-containing protein n=1 Tax=Oxyplasma meridianum TaxID=3073602 RepID=A0AAX4NGM9_9ARCH